MPLRTPQPSVIGEPNSEGRGSVGLTTPRHAAGREYPLTNSPFVPGKPEHVFTGGPRERVSTTTATLPTQAVTRTIHSTFIHSSIHSFHALSSETERGP